MYPKKNIIFITTESYFSDFLVLGVKNSPLSKKYNIKFYYSQSKFRLKSFLTNLFLLSTFDLVEIAYNSFLKKISKKNINNNYLKNIETIENINNSKFIKDINNFKPKLLVSLLCCQIFKRKTISKINCPIVNFHPGILPNYKGLYPNFYSILKKEKNIGITFHLINEKIDEGPTLDKLNYKFDFNKDKIFLLYKTLFFNVRTINFITKSINNFNSLKKKLSRKFKVTGKYYSYPKLAQILSYKFNLYKL